MKKSDIFAPLVIGLACGLILPQVTLFKGVLPGEILKYFPVLLPILSLIGVFVLEAVFKKMPGIIQFAKSFLVGILNSSIDMGVFDFLFKVAVGWSPVLFKVVSFSAGAVNSYFWNKFWTFKKTDTENKSKEVFQFFIVTLIGLLIHTSIIFITVKVVGVRFGMEDEMWASAANMLAIFVGFVWNFLGYKFIVFKK